MKHSEFKKKICKLIDKTMTEGKKQYVYQNTPEALFFTPDAKKAYYAYRLEGSAINEQPGEKAKKMDFSRMMNKAMSTAIYAPMIPGYCESTNGTPAVKFRTEDGERENIFDRRLVHKFPDNARFYLPRGKFEPAIVGIWENDRLNVIGCICPIRVF